MKKLNGIHSWHNDFIDGSPWVCTKCGATKRLFGERVPRCIVDPATPIAKRFAKPQLGGLTNITKLQQHFAAKVEPFTSEEIALAMVEPVNGSNAIADRKITDHLCAVLCYALNGPKVVLLHDSSPIWTGSVNDWNEGQNVTINVPIYVTINTGYQPKDTGTITPKEDFYSDI